MQLGNGALGMGHWAMNDIFWGSLAYYSRSAQRVFINFIQ
jgi:hypothetical protein